MPEESVTFLKIHRQSPPNTNPQLMFSRIPSWLKNKYLISLLVFGLVILFFDKNDLFTQANRRQQLRDLEESKAHYTREIEAERKELEQLKSNPAKLEQYAREKHLMKKDNEDLFLVSEKPVEGKN